MLSASVVQAQAPATARLLDSSRVLLARAVTAGDVGTVRSATALLERALTVAPNDGWLLHYLGYALYRDATISYGRDKSDTKATLERADSILQRAGTAASIAESHALRSGVLGMMIGPNPLKGMVLGPRASNEMDRALEIGANNPRVWLLRGIGAVNTPAMFGGGMENAEKYLKRAVELFATDRPTAPAPSWGAHEAHLWLGRVYAKQERKDLARAEYAKALALEPNDMWIRTTLLPALDK